MFIFIIQTFWLFIDELAGKGLDFGSFCPNTSLVGDNNVVPTGLFSDTEGYYVHTSSATNVCDVTNTLDQNNVVRKAKSINTNSNIPTGQIGLDSDA